MSNINIKLADKNISITCKYDFTAKACKNYIVNSTDIDFSVEVNENDIANEKIGSTFCGNDGYIEFISVYRKIAEQLPKHNRFVMHGAAITYNDIGMLFVAPSGTGKSTHINLWKEVFKDKVDIVNGDKPIVSVQNEKICVYGTPWAGKENWNKNCKANLNAICIIKQSKVNSIKRVNPGDCLPLLLNQVYLPKDSNSLELTLSLYNELLKQVPIYILECNISSDAVMTAYNEIIGNFDFGV